MSAGVKRYYMNEEGYPLVHAGGRWVTYDDHVAALAAATARAEAAEALVATLARWVRQKSKGIGEDWACAQCRPDSGILVDGFVCAVHLAQRVPPNEKELRAIASGANPTHMPCPNGRHARARTDVATGITTCLDCGEGWT